MRTIFTLLISITLGLTQKPIYAAPVSTPFNKPSTVSFHVIDTAQPAKVISLNGSVNSNKIILQWMVAENESADQFEVEKSSDGKNFHMAALVFGTDKAETGQYQFYEKANKSKVSYRIKLINKDRQAAYSDVIEIAPETSSH